ncbi:hypothetical protein B0J13DRAFT_519790 [Dactylonectria estremocensis]|uniref:Zn(2)-C6 fungal-type domain-containing protein n=1 Tax=Dactylonectria estremocensis TaxID=1079267 RepID=A0A9P9FDL4_9HYPO|nr:hypothetical protein B0J13DRAFT_519790 [Dactylonectria estremocensis]
MDETGDARGTKRARGSRGSIPGRRRGPYAMRACDPCRRRKGKCDGRLPCEHCVTRKQHCAFTGPVPGDDVGNRPILGSYKPPSHSGEVECESSSAYLVNAFSSTLLPTTSARNPTMSSPTLHLQQRQGNTALMGLRFHGPTSPDYNLNVAPMRLRHGSFSTTSQRPLLASIDDETVSGDEGNLENGHGCSVSTGSWPSRGDKQQVLNLTGMCFSNTPMWWRGPTAVN